MRLAISIAVLLACPLAAQDYPTPGERARYHLNAAIGPASLAGGAFTTAINQWRDAPPEWGQGMEGFGRRFGYRTARSGVDHGLQFGLGMALGEDPRYFRSPDRRFWARVRHTIAGTFTARDRNGQSKFAASRVFGAYGAGFISGAWHPARLNTPGEGFLRGTYSLLSDIAGSAFEEFWPDVKRKLFGR